MLTRDGVLRLYFRIRSFDVIQMVRVKRKLRILTMTCAVPALMASPALADPAVGFGFTIKFGSGVVEPGFGIRIFSDDEEDAGAVSIGLDYMFFSQTWRGTAGIAYLGDDWFVGFDLGFGLSGEGVDFGISAGGVDTKAPAVAAPAPPPPAPPPPPPPPSPPPPPGYEF